MRWIPAQKVCYSFLKFPQYLCFISTDQTGLYSWFPPNAAWYSSGFNIGHWNAECERFYLSQREHIVEGEAPQASSRWKKLLRMTRAAVKIIEKMELAAVDYLNFSYSSSFQT
jgi:hypothetical protein